MATSNPNVDIEIGLKWHKWRWKTFSI